MMGPGITEAMIFGFGVLSGLVIKVEGFPLYALALGTMLLLVGVKLAGLAP